MPSISSPKKAAFQRVYEKYKRAQESNEKRARELEVRRSVVKATMATPGWKVISNELEASITSLKNQLFQTSSFRLLKCMDIRAEIKALSKVYSSMKTEEISALMREKQKNKG